jgi:hypothetical protein
LTKFGVVYESVYDHGDSVVMVTDSVAEHYLTCLPLRIGDALGAHTYDEYGRERTDKGWLDVANDALATSPEKRDE